MDDTIYDAAGGAEGVLRLAAAWHTRVMADEVVSHAFSATLVKSLDLIRQIF